jgi:transcriptional regulator with XRE-family HTH domain
MPKPAIRIDTDAFQMFRRRAGLTQKALAERAGLSPSQVSRIEGGKVDPLFDTLRALARAMHADSLTLVKDRDGADCIAFELEEWDAWEESRSDWEKVEFEATLAKFMRGLRGG